MCVTQHPKVHHPSDFRKAGFSSDGLKCGFSGGTTQRAYPGSTTSVAFSVNQCRGRRSLVHGPQPSNPVAGGKPLIEGHIYPLWLLSARVYSHLPTGYQIRYIDPTFTPLNPSSDYQSIQRTSFGIYIYIYIPTNLKSYEKSQRTSQRIAGSSLAGFFHETHRFFFSGSFMKPAGSLRLFA